MEQNFSYSIAKVGLPLVVTSSSPHLCFLVDTGASHNIIFSFVLEALNNEYKQMEETFLL